MTGNSLVRLGLQDVAQPDLGRFLDRDRRSASRSSQAWCSWRSLSSSWAWPSSATSPVSRSSSRAWKRRFATATRSRTASPRAGRLEAELVDREAEVVQPADPCADGVPIERRQLRLIVELVPQGAIAVVDRLGRRDGVLERIVAALHRPEVGQPEADVLDEDRRGRTPAGHRTARGGSRSSRRPRDRPGFVAVAPEQRVGQRAVAPVHAGPVEVDEQRGHRVEQPVAIWPRPEREAAEQAAVLDRIGRYSVVRIAPSPSVGVREPTAVTAGRPATSSRRRTSNSAVATPRGSSLSAYVRPSRTRKRTRCRDGPTGRSRNSSVSDGQSASGRCHGRSSRVGAAVAQAKARESRGPTVAGQSFLRR